MDHLKYDLSAWPTRRSQWRRARLCLVVGVVAVVTTFPARAARAQGIFGNFVCAHWCVANFPPGLGRGLCIRGAAHGGGPCHVCGPEGNNTGLCGGICCPPGETCTAEGACAPIECGVVSGDPNAGTAMCGGRCPEEFPLCEFVPGFGGGRCTCVDHQCGGPGTPGVACNENLCPGQEQICTTLADGSCGCGPPPTPSLLQPHCLCIFPLLCMAGAPSCRFSNSPPPVCASDCPSSVPAECTQFCLSICEGCGTPQVEWKCVETGRPCM